MLSLSNSSEIHQYNYALKEVVQIVVQIQRYTLGLEKFARFTISLISLIGQIYPRKSKIYIGLFAWNSKFAFHIFFLLPNFRLVNRYDHNHLITYNTYNIHCVFVCVFLKRTYPVNSAYVPSLVTFNSHTIL